jgi:hypothetical protein
MWPICGLGVGTENPIRVENAQVPCDVRSSYPADEPNFWLLCLPWLSPVFALAPPFKPRFLRSHRTLHQRS